MECQPVVFVSSEPVGVNRFSVSKSKQSSSAQSREDKGLHAQTLSTTPPCLNSFHDVSNNGLPSSPSSTPSLSLPETKGLKEENMWRAYSRISQTSEPIMMETSTSVSFMPAGFGFSADEAEIFQNNMQRRPTLCGSDLFASFGNNAPSLSQPRLPVQQHGQCFSFHSSDDSLADSFVSDITSNESIAETDQRLLQFIKSTFPPQEFSQGRRNSAIPIEGQRYCAQQQAPLNSAAYHPRGSYFHPQQQNAACASSSATFQPSYGDNPMPGSAASFPKLHPYALSGNTPFGSFAAKQSSGPLVSNYGSSMANFQSPKQLACKRSSAAATTSSSPEAERLLPQSTRNNDCIASETSNRSDSASASNATPVPGGSDGATGEETPSKKSASDRERSRMRQMNQAFDALRKILEHKRAPGKRLSKIQALRFAIQYISELEDVLMESSEEESDALMQNAVARFDQYFYGWNSTVMEAADESCSTEMCSQMDYFTAASEQRIDQSCASNIQGSSVAGQMLQHSAVAASQGFNNNALSTQSNWAIPRRDGFSLQETSFAASAKQLAQPQQQFLSPKIETYNGPLQFL